MWLTNASQNHLRVCACKVALGHYQSFSNRVGGVVSVAIVQHWSPLVIMIHPGPESPTLKQGRCLMDPTFSHFGEKLIHLACSKTIEIHFFKQKHKFRVEVRKWLYERHQRLIALFAKQMDLAAGRCVAGWSLFVVSAKWLCQQAGKFGEASENSSKTFSR